MNEIRPTHRHFKGGLYRVICEGRIEDDLTPVTVYQSCETGEVWVRPTTEFNERVLMSNDVAEWTVPRFQLLMGGYPL